MEENYSFCWRDYGENKRNILHHILAEKDFADVTLVSADEKQIHAHKVILCVSSAFFKSIFTRNPHPHPLIYVNDVNHDILQSIIEFIYTGQTNVNKNELKTFIDLGVKLKINGLSDQITQRTAEEVIDERNDLIELPVSHYTSKEVENDTEIVDDNDIKATTENKTNVIEHDPEVSNELYVDPIFIDNNTIEALSEIKTEVNEYVMELDVLEDTSFQLGDISSKEKKKLYNQKYYQNVEKRFSCDQCDHSARYEANLRTHIASMHELVTHTCNLCNKHFTQRSALNRHKQSVHEGFRYTCEICNYCNTKKNKVTNHRRTVHNIYE